MLQHAGADRAKYLLGMLRDEALHTGTMPPFLATTPYRSTIHPEQEAKSPGNRDLEHKIRSTIRWNAVLQVRNRIEAAAKAVSTEICCLSVLWAGART